MEHYIFVVHFLLSIHVWCELTVSLIDEFPTPQSYALSALICSRPCDAECPDGGNFSCKSVELRNIEERQVINYLHKMVIMMVHE